MKQLPGYWWQALALMLSSAANGSECRQPSTGLALGTGGAGGLAHIAMLEVFEDLGLKPDEMREALKSLLDCHSLQPASTP